jgi:hypothetical protein
LSAFGLRTSLFDFFCDLAMAASFAGEKPNRGLAHCHQCAARIIRAISRPGPHDLHFSHAFKYYGFRQKIGQIWRGDTGL